MLKSKRHKAERVIVVEAHICQNGLCATQSFVRQGQGREGRMTNSEASYEMLFQVVLNIF